MVESDDSEFVGELIRCKDCQNFKQMSTDRHGHQPYWCENLNIYSEGPDWFCADGKHKKVSKVEMKEYYDWDDGCYEKVIHYEPDKKGWRYGAKKSRYSEEIKDELVSLMIKYLENHEIFRLLELVVSAVTTKEQEGSVK